ncbi:MAG: Sec-independent protein translocase protein TatB [Hyphomicrobiaceae bacterium]
MLDIGWSELLVVAVITLLVVGPKELPALLRSVGKYLGVVRRHANEFRQQFNEAIKDTEFENVKKEFQELRSETMASVKDASRSIETEMRELDDYGRDIEHDMNSRGSGTEPGSSGAEPEAANSEKEESEAPLALGKSSEVAADGDWIDEHNQAVLSKETNIDADARASSGKNDPGCDDSGETDQGRTHAKVGVAS